MIVILCRVFRQVFEDTNEVLEPFGKRGKFGLSARDKQFRRHLNLNCDPVGQRHLLIEHDRAIFNMSVKCHRN